MEINFTTKMEPGEYNAKVSHARGLLRDAQKVKLKFKLIGREMAHSQIGFEVIKQALLELANVGRSNAEPRLIGRIVVVYVTPLNH